MTTRERTPWVGTTPASGRRLDLPHRPLRRAVGESMWVLIVAGIPVGVLVAGIGSRVAMYALRLSSPNHVRGLTSDDGFEIGRFTLSGTVNLLMLGAAVGVVGTLVYRIVQPWLLGPTWFRRATVAAASGAVVGSMLIHADGVDFTVLKPTWFAVALFVSLPALFGAVIATVVDRVVRRPPPSGRRAWVVPVVLLVAFPLTIPIVAMVALAIAAWVTAQNALDGSLAVPPAAGWAIRALWLAIATAGLVALVRDVQALS